MHKEMKMYLWNINALKETLSNEGLTQKSSLYYILLWMVFVTLTIEISIHFPKENINVWDTIYSYGAIIITAIGTVLFYRANGGEDSDNLFERYFSLSIVVSIRLIPLFVILLLMLEIFIDPLNTTPLEVIFLLSWSGFVYHRMISHVRDVVNA